MTGNRHVRVLHLITRFLDGGAETTTVHTLKALREANREYDLRLGVGAEHDPGRLAAVDADTHVFRLIRHCNPVALAGAIIEVSRYLRRESIDLIHTHSTEAGIVGRLAAALADVPVVVHEVHGDPITPDRNAVLNAVVERLERRCASYSSALVVKSALIERTYLDRGIGRPESYELIYHGVDVDRFRDAEPAPDIDAQGTVVTYVGRLVEGKGLFDLLAAVERIDEQVSLLVVGDGPLEDAVREAISDRGLDGTVRLLGFRENVPAVLTASDVFVLPSYREGTPRAITEALAAGVPVVATDIAGIPEQVSDGETGFLVAPGNIEALADRLATLVRSPELRAEMSAVAGESVDHFRIETAARQYRHLYDRLLTERGYDSASTDS